jgi:hypothetical protein
VTSNRFGCKLARAQPSTSWFIPECDTNEDAEEVLNDLWEEIFEEELAGWYTDTSTWPKT